MAIAWRNINEEKPEDGQDCITKMKHGVIQGWWDEEEKVFRRYYWNELEWYGSHWAPAEEVV